MTEHADLNSLGDDELAKAVLREVMQDRTAPAAARAQAARTLLELTGDLGKHAKPPADPSRPTSSLTRDELEAELGGLVATQILQGAG